MIDKLKNKFIVYRHVNPVNGDVFYIGIGRLGREKQVQKRSTRWINYINKYGFLPEVLFTGLTWHEACSKEKEFIKLLGRKDLNTGLLINMTNGGDGSGGHKWKLGVKRGPLSDAHKKKLSETSPKYWLGKSVSEETKDKIRAKRALQTNVGGPKGATPWNKGLKGVQVSGRKGKKYGPLSEEHKAKMSKSNTGKKRSQELKDKISAKHKGRIITPEWRKKISDTLLKRKQLLCQTGS